MTKRLDQAPMTANPAYILRECAIGAIISSILSAIFVVLVFNRESLAFPDTIAMDSIPQTFMVSMMASLVPTLIARSKVNREKIDIELPSPSSKWCIIIFAVLLASASTMLLLPIHAALLPLVAPYGVSFTALLIGKMVYGTVVGATSVFMGLRNFNKSIHPHATG